MVAFKASDSLFYILSDFGIPYLLKVCPEVEGHLLSPDANAYTKRAKFLSTSLCEFPSVRRSNDTAVQPDKRGGWVPLRPDMQPNSLCLLNDLFDRRWSIEAAQ